MNSTVKNPNTSLPFYINALADSMRADMNRHLEPCNITWKQLFILMNCDMNGGRISIGELPGTISIDAGATTRLVKRLEKKDWVLRRQDSKDKRRTTVEMTPEGRKVMLKASKIRLKVLDSLLSNLAPKEQDTLHKLLHKFYDMLSKEWIGK